MSYSDTGSDRSNNTSPHAPASNGSPYVEEPVVARVSYHILREERAFHISKSLVSSADPTSDHIIRPLEIHRLQSHPTDRGVIIVTIYELPGPNYLYRVLDMGSAFFWADKEGDRFVVSKYPSSRPVEQISVQHFLDFAIGATECLEILHHGEGIVHGEIRGDAFHYNVEVGKVKLTSFGSGTKSIDITNTGWAVLEREVGAMNKLCYISPEQTGRTQSEPDSRTDIYSLGILFYTLLIQKPAFDGKTPMDVMQMVLSRKVPSITDRLDIPQVIDKIIQKCTSKSVADRYHSASGLRHDLIKVQEFMSAGDEFSLRQYQIGAQDVSSFFMLPTAMIGRSQERCELLRVIDRVAKSHILSQNAAVNRFSDASGLASELFEELSNEGTGSVDGNRRSGSFATTVLSDPARSRNNFPSPVQADIQTIGVDSVFSSQSLALNQRMARAWERHQSASIESRSLADAGNDAGCRLSTVETMASSSLSRQIGSVKFKRRGQCEIAMVEGDGGVGKSCLIQSVLAEATRRGGYYATAKFDTARRMAFQPLLRLVSSLFKQVYGETNTETPFHEALRAYVRPVWPTLHQRLGLPEFLIAADKETATPIVRSDSTATNRNGMRLNSSPGTTTAGPPSATEKCPSPFQMSQPSQQVPALNQSLLQLQMSQPVADERASVVSASSTPRERVALLDEMPQAKQVRLLNTLLEILRMFTHYKFICFFIEDLHFADAEGLDLITSVVSARLKMAIVVTFRPDEMSPESVLSVFQPRDSEGGITHFLFLACQTVSCEQKLVPDGQLG